MSCVHYQLFPSQDAQLPLALHENLQKKQKMKKTKKKQDYNHLHLSESEHVAFVEKQGTMLGVTGNWNLLCTLACYYQWLFYIFHNQLF